MIKAVIFDIDGVLLDSKDANAEFLRRVFVAHNCKPVSRLQYARVSHLTMRQFITRFAKNASEEKIEAMFQYGNNSPAVFELYKIPKGADETIKLLHKNYRLAVVSNRTKKGIQRYLDFAKTEKYFSVFVSSEDITHPKPHPESLLLAAKRLNLNPKECVYVGDTKSDLIAANKADMKAIIYAKRPVDGACYSTFSFRKILSLIEKF